MLSPSASVAVVVLVDVAAATGCALWPLWPGGPGLAEKLSALGWGGVACNSNADLWGLAALRCSLVTAIWAFGASPCAPGGTFATKVAGAILTYAFEVALLAKMVIVASCGAEHTWPDTSSGKAGLIMIFIPATLGLVLVHLQSHYLGKATASPTHKARASKGEKKLEEGLAEPLLGKKENEDYTTKQLAMELVRLTAPDSLIVLFGTVAGLGAAVMNAYIPKFVGKGIDFAAIEANHSQFIMAMAHLIIVVVANAVLVTCRGGLFSVVGVKLALRVRERLFASLLRQEISFFDETGTGTLSSRLQADTTALSSSVGIYINVLARSLMQLGVVTFFMARASWRLTVVTLVVVPAGKFVTQVYERHYSALQKHVLTCLAKVNGTAEEVLSGIATVRAHAAERSTLAAYRSGLMDVFKLQAKQCAMYSGYAGFCVLVPNFALVWVLFLGGHLVLVGDITAGILVSFILYEQSFAACCQTLGNCVTMFSDGIGSTAKVAELMNREPRIVATNGVMPRHFEGRVELKGVQFTYPTRPDALVLDDLSFKVNPGEVVALVGLSGGGKSTVMKLLQRFYIPQAGEVLFDGRDVGDYDERWLKRRVAMVGQEPTLFDRTIRQNVILGMEPEDGVEQIPTQEEIEEACRMANAHDFITAMPCGYDTLCGEKGIMLSGGQKQRIAIARALIRKPSVLILDEATSALDAQSEALVQEALDRCLQNRTVFVIAHRLSTIQCADRILVVNDGRLIETGTHTELLERQGIYASLVRRQMQGPLDLPAPNGPPGPSE
ncbi:unnamed protein product [Ostreobium quekettii]|uniref:Uncharacterized protein n=1 Tax=Ostreobium quekettii TaxID=121088 RepID=A0A8S1ING5_9CHLO|nr:unnamed protein product [Ostreobium quekettii]|eukprot:evm.model.scf_1633.1 EVM.evm.TU.scf_1633.1   scf_1633:20451-31477(-)